GGNATAVSTAVGTNGGFASSESIADATGAAGLPATGDPLDLAVVAGTDGAAAAWGVADEATDTAASGAVSIANDGASAFADSTADSAGGANAAVSLSPAP
ncbi:hypothetical protein D4R42_05465, partial [bacterium]